MRQLNSQDLFDLSYGAALLGTGGGGDPYIGRLIAQQCLDDGLSIDIIEPSEVADEALIIPTASMGAPTVVIEKIPSGTEAIHSLRELEEHLGKKAHATMPVEVGGINSTIPLFVGARLGIPIVDADGMGRAFPEFQMLTFGVYGVSGTPAVVSNEFGDTVLIKTAKNSTAEQYARAATVQMGGSAYLSEYPMTGLQMKKTAVPNTLSLAIRLGREVRIAKERNRDPVQALLDVLPETQYGFGKVVFEGKILDVEREMRNGFAYGEVRIQSFDNFNREMKIQIQNEYLVARVDGEVRAIVPDLICVLDLDTALPITTERLRYGQRVLVMSIAVPEIMRTTEALEVFGPSGFGIDEAYKPIESIS